MVKIKYDFLLQLPEQKLRSSFDGYMDYLLYCFSLTGSLANLTRFPYLAYSYNGCKIFIILRVYFTRVRGERSIKSLYVSSVHIIFNVDNILITVCHNMYGMKYLFVNISVTLLKLQ